MSSTLTPNMSLVIPGVGTESGPNYAQEINNSLTILDSHNHSSGSGVQINPTGININSVLPFNGNAAYNLGYANFTLLASPPTTAQSIYVQNGTESAVLPDLFYFDGANNVQITAGGQVNATIASLPGQSYVAGVFAWKQGTGSTVPANFDIGSIVVRPNTAGTTEGVTIAPSGSLASAFTLFLPPQLPMSTQFLTLDSTGNITTSSNISASQIAVNSILGTQIAQQTITQDLLAPRATGSTVGIGGVAINAGSNSTTAASYVLVTQVTITTTGRPIQVMVSGGAGNGYFSVSTAGASQLGTFSLFNGGTQVASTLLSAAAGSVSTVPAALSTVDTQPAGTYSYNLQILGVPGNLATVSAQNCTLVAYEL